MKTVSRITFCLIALVGISLTSCDSDNNQEIVTTQTINSCYAAVTDISTGTTTYATGVTFGLNLNWSTAVAEITVAGLKIGDESLPHIMLAPMNWRADQNNNDWYVASATVTNGASTSYTTYTLNDFNFNWTARNLSSLLSDPSMSYYPSCVFSFELDGKYKVVGARTPFIFFGETTSTAPDGSKSSNNDTYYTITPDLEHLTASIELDKVMFVSGMPVMSDMIFPDIPMTINENGVITLSATNFIPQIKTDPYPNFPISDLSATIDPIKGMTMTFKCDVNQSALYTVDVNVTYNTTSASN